MSPTYSTYEAKAHFSELLRQVRGGKVIRITWRGRAVAELRPLPDEPDLSRRIELLEERGILSRSSGRRGSLAPLARREGALARFLEERE